MSLFKIFRGNSSRISTDVTPFHDGYAYFSTDDGGFYIDAETEGGEQKRILVNPKSTEVQTSLSASAWSEGAQTISVTNMTATQNGIIAVDGELDDEMMEEVKNADLSIAEQAAGSLTIEAKGTQPTHDIPVVIVLFA